jgi:hypothetical protein
MERLFKSLIIEFYDGNSPFNQFAVLIKFAWESMDMSRGQAPPPFIKKAQEYIHASKKIVIIGYSFPLYNRLVDLSFLNQSSLVGKTILIQDPDAKNLKSTFSEGFSIDFNPATGTFCETITDCKSFSVPRDVFIKD